MTLEPAQLAPSIDQLDAVNAILRDREHPLRTGLIVTGHTATYNPGTLVYSLAVEVIEQADEIYAAHATRCYRIAPDGSIIAVAVAR